MNLDIARSEARLLENKIANAKQQITDNETIIRVAEAQLAPLQQLITVEEKKASTSQPARSA